MRDNWGKIRQKKYEKEEKRGNRSKNESNLYYPYFVSLFNIGPYDCQKSPQKSREISKGGGEIFQGGHNIYPCIKARMTENNCENDTSYLLICVSPGPK